MSAGSVILNQPGVLLYDADGNAIATTDDGGAHKLETIGKHRNAAGAVINPSTEETLGTRASETTLASRASESTLGSLESKAATEVTLAAVAAKDFATQTTLETIATQATAAAIQAVLEAIRDTAGIKKITDALPAGTNNIGDVDVVSSALPAGAATEATLSSVDSKVATESTLAALEAKAATETTLASLEAKAATETTLAAADNKLGTIDGVLDSIKDTDGIKKIVDQLPAGTNNIGDVDVVSSALPAGAATEATLATLTTQATAAAIQAVLEAIRDTAGVKKITDQLPAGTNEIGKVAQGTKAAGTGAWPSALYDAAGNPVAVVLDNSIYRLESRGTVVGQEGGAGAELKVTTLPDQEDVNQIRLQTEARIAPGSVINIGTAIPANPASLIVSFLTDTGGDHNMLVNGGGTAVPFTYAPTTGQVVALQEVLIVFSADDFTFDGLSFGPNAVLSNGVKLEVSLDSVVTEIFNIKQNEDYIRIPGRIPLVNNTGPKDLLGVSFQFGGLIKLHQADGDYISVTVRDNLTSVKFKYLTGTVYATEEL